MFGVYGKAEKTNKIRFQLWCINLEKSMEAAIAMKI